jgi:nucleotide-binding universal stress UspA family protein
MRRVILAVDGSTHSDAAARTLAAFPLSRAATVDVIAVATPWTAPDLDGAVGGPRELLAAHQEIAAEIAARAVGVLTAAGLEAEAVVRTGDPGREIVETARTMSADLVVLGSRGRGGVKGLLLGSVSRRVAATAPCSVLVVPAPRRPTLPRG